MRGRKFSINSPKTYRSNMSYDQQDAEVDALFDQISEEVYPEHKVQAIEEFVKERMQSYFLRYPEILQRPVDCLHHAGQLKERSSRCSLVMYATATELFLKLVILKPTLYGMFHNEKVAEGIVENVANRGGLSRYESLLGELCLQVAGIQPNEISGVDNKPILREVDAIHGIRNRVLHRGEDVAPEKAEKAREITCLVCLKLVGPVLVNLDLETAKNESGSIIIQRI